MQVQELMTNIFERISQELEKALGGLTQEELDQQPSNDTNSIGWLAWHFTRYQDLVISDLLGKDQLWISKQWYAKFGRSASPHDFGFGHTSEDLAAFKSPDVQVLLDYHHAVLEQTKNYIGKLSEADLDQETGDPRWPTLGARLEGVISDKYQHAGQIAFIRGLLKGRGWWEAARGIPVKS